MTRYCHEYNSSPRCSVRHPRRLGDRLRHRAYPPRPLAAPAGPLLRSSPSARAANRSPPWAACASLPTSRLAELRPQDSAMLILAGGDRWDQDRWPASAPRPGASSPPGCRSRRSAARHTAWPWRGCSTTARTPATPPKLASAGTRSSDRYVAEPAVTDGDLITASAIAPVHFARAIFARMGLYEPGVGRVLVQALRGPRSGRLLRARCPRDPPRAGPVVGRLDHHVPAERPVPRARRGTGPPSRADRGVVAGARGGAAGHRCPWPASPAKWAWPGRASSGSPTSWSSAAWPSTVTTRRTAGPSCSSRPRPAGAAIGRIGPAHAEAAARLAAVLGEDALADAVATLRALSTALGKVQPGA